MIQESRSNRSYGRRSCEGWGDEWHQQGEGTSRRKTTNPLVTKD